MPTNLTPTGLLVAMSLIAGFVLLAGTASAADPVPVGRLRCEYRQDPLGIQTATPQFSWTLESGLTGDRQTAYRLLVASSHAQATAEQGDLWDSGKVESASTLYTPYAGKALGSMCRYFWRVRLWNASGQTALSPVQSFVTGKLTAADWKGSWIEAGVQTKNAIYVRKTFTLAQALTAAYLSICGLGGADVFVNGRRLSEELPITSPSNVPNQHNKRTYAAGYTVHELTALLKPGDNCLGVVLGNAFYHSSSWLNQYDIGQVKLICDLDLRLGDGTTASICSDASWRWSFGAIRFHDMRYGQEDLDLREEQPGWSTVGFAAKDWKPVRLVAPQLPKDILRARQEGPIVVHRTMAPKQVDGEVYTFPEYWAGHVRFTASGEAGHEILVSNFRRPSRFILRGQGQERYEQRFCLQGTHQVKIEAKGAKIDDVAFHATATRLEPTGSFTCSDPVLNELSQAGHNTARLMTVGLVGAEMEREKAGWGEDGKNALDVGIYSCDMLTVGRKWLRDFLDRQEENGANPSVIPMVNGVGYNGIWQGNALNHVAWNLYWHYGDPRILAEAYDGMQRTMHLLAGQAKGDPRQLMGFTLGDWLTADNPPPLTGKMIGTIQYYDYAVTMSRTAAVLGKTQDTATYTELATGIRANFNQLFWNAKTGLYQDDAGKAITAIQAMAIWFGVVPDDQRALATARLKDMVVANRFHPATGFGSTASLLGVLMRNYPETAYAMLQEPTAPSFRSNVTLGQCGENWGGGPLGWASLTGNFNRHVYEFLGGIQPLAAGFTRIAILPVPMARLSEVTCHYDSVSGTIRSHWRKIGDTYEHQVTVPANTSAIVGIPRRAIPGRLIDRVEVAGTTVWAEGRHQGKVSGLKAEADDARHIRFAVPAGTFGFLARTVPCTTPLPTVQSLAATKIHPRVVRLQWLPAEDPAGRTQRYRVYRDGVRLPEVDVCQYTDREAGAGKTCSYQVCTLDEAGMEGAKSSPLTVAIPIHLPNDGSVLALDATTSGAWKGRYGKDGYDLRGGPSALPPYAQVKYLESKTHVWSATTAETRVLSDPDGTARAACEYGTPLLLEVQLTDAQTHQLSLYLLDWDRAGRVTTLEVLDPEDREPLVSQELSKYGDGVYVRLQVRGRVLLRLTSRNNNAVLSGLFFDRVPTEKPSP